MERSFSLSLSPSVQLLLCCSVRQSNYVSRQPSRISDSSRQRHTVDGCTADEINQTESSVDAVRMLLQLITQYRAASDNTHKHAIYFVVVHCAIVCAFHVLTGNRCQHCGESKPSVSSDKKQNEIQTQLMHAMETSNKTLMDVWSFNIFNVSWA